MMMVVLEKDGSFGDKSQGKRRPHVLDALDAVLADLKRSKDRPLRS